MCDHKNEHQIENIIVITEIIQQQFVKSNYFKSRESSMIFDALQPLKPYLDL